MHLEILIAVPLQLVGSFCFALAALHQNVAVRRQVRLNQSRHHLKFGQLIDALKTRRWWIGTSLMCVSLICQVTALYFAPVSVVQPLGLLAFPWSVLLQALASKRRVGPDEASLVSLTVLAALAFTAMVSVYSSPNSHLVTWQVFAGMLTIYCLAGIFAGLGARGPAKWRSLFWGSGGAMFYGLEAALVRSLMNYARQNYWVNTWQFWTILVLLLLGATIAGWMVQQGYATGQAENVVASMTITSPIVAVCFGIAVLGEGHEFTTGIILGILLCALVAIAGVIRLSYLKMEQDPPLTQPGMALDAWSAEYATEMEELSRQDSQPKRWTIS